MRRFGGLGTLERPARSSAIVACTAAALFAGAASGQDSRFLDALRAGEAARECAACPELLLAPAGEFEMGSRPTDLDAGFDEAPMRVVTIDAFAMGVAPITRQQYKYFVDQTGYFGEESCESYDDSGAFGVHFGRSWRNAGIETGDDHPVVCVSHQDALAYIEWLNGEVAGGEPVYRLPSEAEWEYVARAGGTDIYAWGSDVNAGCAYMNGADLSALAQFSSWTVVQCDDGWVYTAPISALEPNAFGFRHMIGNVWEWMADCWHSDYTGAPSDGAPWLDADGGDCGFRMQRGGAWDSLPAAFRVSQRSAVLVDDRSFLAGFRVVRDLR